MSSKGTNKRPIESDEPSRNKRRRRGNKSREEENDLLDMELKVNQLFKSLDSQLTADHYLRQLTRFGADLSPIELADLTISGTSPPPTPTPLPPVTHKLTAYTANAIKDTSSWEQSRVTDNMPAFVEKFTAKPELLSRADKTPGSPHTLIVAGAGLRSADIVRAMRKFQGKNCAVAKLFAKHMKVAEQVAFLAKQRVGMGVGTPARLAELIENGALKMDKLQRIVVDASYIDQKKRGIMDMKDTMMPLASFLTRKELQERYLEDDKHVDLIFY
ncbi:hypothetical protein TD95_000822 [Thielaviopsis punctulata]|uniref:Protein CMS1 n=1 Tax=Thielaviopsis punctulata TaxID=72032 RepID=A0A0F4ZL03_9PEZI|nr:hypothetical protein TD95_000822 [Thielaviopsis punctulata]